IHTVLLIRHQLLLRWKIDAGVARIAYWWVCHNEADFSRTNSSQCFDDLGRTSSPYDAVVDYDHVLAFDNLSNRDNALVNFYPAILIRLDKTAHGSFLAVPVLEQTLFKRESQVLGISERCRSC